MKFDFEALRGHLATKRFRYYSTLSLVFLIYFYISYYTRDPDLGWHLKAGQYFIEKGIPRYDVFSFTATNFPWINHEWANDILMHLLHASGGKLALSAFFAALWCVSMFLASRKLQSFVLLIAALSMLPFAGVRPVVWTVFFVASLERILESKNSRLRYMIPLIFFFWANLHGSFAFGLLLLVLWQIFHSSRISWPIFFASFLAVFMNPYFARVFLEIGGTLGDWSLRFQIEEWFPLKLPWISVIFISLYLVTNFAVNKHPIKKLISIPGLALAMALSSIRHFPIFATTSLRYVEEYLDELSAKLSKVETPRWFRIAKIVVLSLSALAVCYFSLTIIRASAESERFYPTKFVRNISSLGCNKNLFNEYGFGGFIIEKLPDYKTYIDGRMPSWKLGDKKYFDDYRKFSDDNEFRKKEIEKYNINCVIISSGNELQKKLENNGWKVVSEASSPNYVLLKKY